MEALCRGFFRFSMCFEVFPAFAFWPNLCRATCVPLLLEKNGYEGKILQRVYGSVRALFWFGFSGHPRYPLYMVPTRAWIPCPRISEEGFCFSLGFRSFPTWCLHKNCFFNFCFVCSSKMSGSAIACLCSSSTSGSTKSNNRQAVRRSRTKPNNVESLCAIFEDLQDLGVSLHGAYIKMCFQFFVFVMYRVMQRVS